MEISWPIVPGQLGRMQVANLVGELTGMVFCPLRKSSIAVMRCAEYQKMFRCHENCPNAVTRRELRPVLAAYKRAVEQGDKLSASQRRRPGAARFNVCRVCDEPKPRTASPCCRSCGAHTSARRRQGRTARRLSRERFGI